MGLIFWVDEDKFVSDLVGKVFQKKGLDFYHLENVDEFAFRVLDLKPEIIVLDGKSLDQNKEFFERTFSENIELRECSYVFKGRSNFSLPIQSLGILSLPLDPFQVPAQIEAMSER